MRWQTWHTRCGISAGSDSSLFGLKTIIPPLWLLKGWERFASPASSAVCRLAFCRFGTRWRKNTRFGTNTKLQGVRLLQCSGRLLQTAWKGMGQIGWALPAWGFTVAGKGNAWGQAQHCWLLPRCLYAGRRSFEPWACRYRARWETWSSCWWSSQVRTRRSPFTLWPCWRGRLSCVSTAAAVQDKAS